jgi:hypothetical protein
VALALRDLLIVTYLLGRMNELYATFVFLLRIMFRRLFGWILSR